MATPPVRSQLIANPLPDAVHVIFPGHTHDQLGGLSLCVKDVFNRFITDPSLTPDTSCVETPDYIGFRLPDGNFRLIPEEETTPETDPSEDGQLTQTAGQDAELTRISAAELVGKNWTLLELAEGQPVAADSEITLSFGEGLVSGSGGCNSYKGIFSLGEDNPLTMTIGPLAATRQTCPDPLGSQEDVYFATLEGTSEWGYLSGKLGLFYPNSAGDGLDRLLFVAGEESSPDKEETVVGETKPDYVLALGAAYGGPSQEGFGGAVFFKQAAGDGVLEETAKKYYQYFVGDLWQQWGEEAWMLRWKQVYTREAGAEGDIVRKLRAIDDRDAGVSVPLIVNVNGDVEAAHKALAGAFDAPDVEDLRVYNIGDGAALSGLLVAGQREGCFRDQT